eukprot:gene4239-4489_t
MLFTLDKQGNDRLCASLPAAPFQDDFYRQGGNTTSWCAFGVDVAGTNLQQLTSGVDTPRECGVQCSLNPGCSLWGWVASQEGSGQAPHNCFVKADAFRGQNGWTGAANFPERVSWAEARASCTALTNGTLATPRTREQVARINQQLLSTLPSQTAVRSAWIGATGVNAQYKPNASASTRSTQQQREGHGSTFVPSIQSGQNHSESTLTWLTGGRVASNLLRRLSMLPSLWTVHDVIQTMVPPNKAQVCARVLVELPPSSGPVDPSAVLPGIWFFDCDLPAAYICESSARFVDPLSQGRVQYTAAAIAAAASDIDNAGASASSHYPVQQWKLAVGIAVPLLFLLLFGLQLHRAYSRKLLRLPEIIRQQRKRALGQPRSGRMSVVVTDIQGFTHLMRAAPDQMAQALLMHNQVIQHAVYDNVGYVLEQEGDSFTLVFHEAEDAVAFALQVQQALLEQPWPPAVCYHDSWESGTAEADLQAALSPAGDMGDLQTGASSSPVLSNGNVQSDGCEIASSRPTSKSSNVWGHRSPAAWDVSGEELGQVAGGDLELNVGGFNDWRSTVNCRGSLVPSFGLHEAPSMSPAGSQLSGWHKSTRAAPAGSPQLSPTAGSASSSSVLRFGSALKFGAGSAASGALFGRRRNQWLQQLLTPRNQQLQLFAGARVRVGVATGYVAQGQEVKNSQLYKVAQDVSTAALGGQVLVDEATFQGVKEALWRLGAVLATGINYDLIYGSRRNGPATDAEASGLSPPLSKLWTMEEGRQLVQQYQAYLQQQLLHHVSPSGGGSTGRGNADEAFQSMASGDISLDLSALGQAMLSNLQQPGNRQGSTLMPAGGAGPGKLMMPPRRPSEWGAVGQQSAPVVGRLHSVRNLLTHSLLGVHRRSAPPAADRRIDR